MVRARSLSESSARCRPLGGSVLVLCGSLGQISFFASPHRRIGKIGRFLLHLHINEQVMLGAIIGDIVGSRFEFANTHRTDFELFADGCNYTDDTICTIAVADALLGRGDFAASL